MSSQKRKIGIIGYGYVGKAFYKFFTHYSHFEVCVYDSDTEIQKSCEYIKNNTDFLDNMDLIVVCVPTNALSCGGVDLSAIEESLKVLKQPKLVLIKSSIPPLSTQALSVKYPHLRIVVSPEYIGENSYFLPYPYDFDKEVIKTPYFIFGGNKEDTQEVIKFFQQIAGPAKEYIQTTSISAEVCKYMENTFFATKIIFCNEFAKICENIGADYNEVRELWLKDTRITKTHTLILNEEDDQCFSGKCLPKDLSGIIQTSFHKGYRAKFLESVELANKTLRQEAQKPNILTFHRIMLDNNVEALYFDRKMAITYYTLEETIESYLRRGFSFGSIRQCLSEPNKYFCCSFDDGFKEHLEVAKRLHKKYDIPRESLIFSINVNHSLQQIYCGMDIIYYLAYNNRLKEVFAYFNLEYTDKSLLQNIEILKSHYIVQDSPTLKDFSSFFACDLSFLFLDSIDIQTLSQYGVIASHSLYHRDLRKHTTQSLQEILESKHILEALIQQEVDIICYPEGKSDVILQDFCKQHFKFGLSLAHKKDNNYCIGRKLVAL